MGHCDRCDVCPPSRSLSLTHTHTLQSYTAHVHVHILLMHIHLFVMMCVHMSADRRCVTAQLNALGVFVGVNGDAKERSLR